MMFMKMIRTVTASFLALSLALSLLVGTVLPTHAAEIDVDACLAKALGVSSSDRNNYDGEYKKSLPIDYEATADSLYVAFGGDTAYGQAYLAFEDYYTDKVGAKYGIDYDNCENLAKSGMFASEAVSHIERSIAQDRNRKISKADLITVQLDAAAIVAASVNDLMDELDIPWKNYISDTSFSRDMENFRNQVVSEYTAEYGKSTAESIALVLEYMLYECVVYSHETIKSVQKLRSVNGNAVILVVGLYHPLDGLSFTAGGKVIKIGEMVQEMIDVCNVYLLKKTKGMNNVAFIDISDAPTVGFGNLTLDVNDADAVRKTVLPVFREDVHAQVTKETHNYICNQIVNSAKAPCKHTNTTVKNAAPASCKENGYTGDTVCSDCGAVTKTGTKIDKLTTHTFGAWAETKPSSCKEKGKETRTCSVCGKTEDRDLAIKEHVWDNGKVTKPATCTVNGEKTITCTSCKTTKTEVIPAGHSWDEGKITKQPGCETKGERAVTCTVCGKASVEPIPATGHKWDTGTVTKAPGCETAGEKTFTCDICKSTKKEAVPATGHAWDNGTVTKEHTCTVDGEKTFTCNTCNETKTEAIPAAHSWDEGSVTKQPDCENAGEKAVTCTACGEASVEIIPATGHHYGEYVSNGDATCRKDGTKTAVCDNCGEKDTIADPGSVTDHRYEDGLCIFCGAEEPSNSALGLILGISGGIVGISGVAVVVYVLYKKKILFR